MIVKIRKRALQSIIEAAKNAFPKEFMAYLSGKNNVIEELVIVPSIYTRSSAIAYEYYLPNLSGMNIIGTVHSHPSDSFFPSGQDKQMFARFGGIHLIISFPFNEKSIAAFSAEGKRIHLEVVE